MRTVRGLCQESGAAQSNIAQVETVDPDSCQCYDEVEICCTGEVHDDSSQIRERRLQALGEVKIKEGAVVEIHLDEVDPPQKEDAKPRSTRDLGFAGMWADHNDITDGLSYVDCLRDNPRK
jgi:hypothetical protein